MALKSVNQRLIVLQLIRPQKEILFGAFTPSLTKKKKESAWEQVRVDAIAAGAAGLSQKDWTYVRDSIWSAARRDTLAKKDRAKKSGEGSVQWNEVGSLF